MKNNNENLPDQKARNRKTLIILFIIVILMFGFGFALVPFYDLLCKATGLNGKTENTASAPIVISGQSNQLNQMDQSREITVQFVANTNAYLPWEFYPLVKEIKIHPGENMQVAYYAKNNSGHTMTVQAIPSVTPGYAARYLKKTECFCFTQQTFKAGEGRDMPLLFHIDAALPKDVRVLTLSYTMFDAAQFPQKNNKLAGKISG